MKIQVKLGRVVLHQFHMVARGLQAIGFKLIHGVKPLRANKKNNQASLQGQSLEWKEKLLGVKTKWNKKGQQGQWRKGPC